MNKAKIYHDQAEIDKFAKEPDLEPAIISTTMRLIKEAYKEFMDDLLQEA